MQTINHFLFSIAYVREDRSSIVFGTNKQRNLQSALATFVVGSLKCQSQSNTKDILTEATKTATEHTEIRSRWKLARGASPRDKQVLY